MFKFNKKFFASFLVLFIIEVFIAMYVHDRIIRPFVGDMIVVWVVYCFVRSFINKRIKWLPIYVFIFAAFIEGLQYINIVEILNIQSNRILSIALGSTFDIKDIGCYFVGCLILLSIHKNPSKQIDTK